MELENKIKDVINTIRPFLISDGGDVEFIRFENGVVYVKLLGACTHCVAAGDTLENMIQDALVFEIPEVIKVENIQNNG